MEEFARISYKPYKKKTGRREMGDHIENRAQIDANTKLQMAKFAARKEAVGVGQRTAKLIMDGSNDRINAILYDPQKYDNDKDQGAYRDGFFRHGGNRLHANLKTISPENLYEIGYNDCLSGVDINTLSSAIKINEDYLRGYRIALQSIQDLVYGPSKPRNR